MLDCNINSNSIWHERRSPQCQRYRCRACSGDQVATPALSAITVRVSLPPWDDEPTQHDRLSLRWLRQSLPPLRSGSNPVVDAPALVVFTASKLNAAGARLRRSRHRCRHNARTGGRCRVTGYYRRWRSWYCCREQPVRRRHAALAPELQAYGRVVATSSGGQVSSQVHSWCSYQRECNLEGTVVSNTMVRKTARRALAVKAT
jgi:hypothetical protein